MRWLCEIGRIDILTETSLLLIYLSCPRARLLHQALHIFRYLKDHKRSKVVFYSSSVNINGNHLPHEDMVLSKATYISELYPDAKEEKLSNAPNAKEKSVQITCFVHANHGGDQIPRRSRIGILIYVNMVPIIWWSKR